MYSKDKPWKRGFFTELLNENLYSTASIKLGRDFNEWSKEEKVSEINKLYKQFERPFGGSPLRHTLNLIDELLDSFKIKDYGVDAKVFADLNWEISEYIEQQIGGTRYLPSHLYSHRKDEVGKAALRKMIDIVLDAAEKQIN